MSLNILLSKTKSKQTKCGQNESTFLRLYICLSCNKSQETSTNNKCYAITAFKRPFAGTNI